MALGADSLAYLKREKRSIWPCTSRQSSQHIRAHSVRILKSQLDKG
jgi:hypothetical protein